MKKLLPLLLCLALLLGGCAETYDGPTKTKRVVGESVSVNISPATGQRFSSRYVYSYDIYGNTAQYSFYSENELQEVERRRFDENGNRISSVRWNYTGLIPWIELRTEKVYDDQGRMVADISKNWLGIETGRATYTYDDENFIKTHTWSGDNMTTTYYCDENWNTLRSVSDHGLDATHTYDDRGNCVATVTYYHGEFWGRSETAYDEQNRIVSWANYDEKNECVARGTYTYDEENRTQTRLTENSRQVEYLNHEGEIYLIEDYDLDGQLRMYQQYTFTEIRVPTDRKE